MSSSWAAIAAGTLLLQLSARPQRWGAAARSRRRRWRQDALCLCLQSWCLRQLVSLLPSLGDRAVTYVGIRSLQNGGTESGDLSNAQFIALFSGIYKPSCYPLLPSNSIRALRPLRCSAPHLHPSLLAAN